MLNGKYTMERMQVRLLHRHGARVLTRYTLRGSTRRRWLIPKHTYTIKDYII